MSQPPALLTIIARAIRDKTGDDHAARREVAEAVIEAMKRESLECPSCGARAYAEPTIELLCGICDAPMQRRKS